MGELTTEEAFQAHLDAHPEDSFARQVFADWLDERGDARGPGYRFLGRRGLYPIQDHISHHKNTWVWGMWFYHGEEEAPLIRTSFPETAKDHNHLPPDLMRVAETRRLFQHGNRLWLGYSQSRSIVDDTAARAFAALKPERQAELLASYDPSAFRLRELGTANTEVPA